MKILKNLTLFALLFFAIISLGVYASKLDRVPQIDTSIQGFLTQKNCKNLSYSDSLYLHPKNFKKFNLGIEFESTRAWRKSLLNSLVKSEESKKKYNYWRKFSDPDSRPRSKAKIIMFKDGKQFCFLDARVRVHGDLIHDQRDASILPSLNINLNNGHIFGITKFILFLPQARQYDNEIFSSTLYSELGFLSPKTTYVNVIHGKNSKKFIFQEKIVKEFLESKLRRESPIIEGDERFAFLDNRHKQNLSKARIVNSNWSKKNDSAFKISSQSISLLNHLDQIHYTEKLPNDNTDYYFIEKVFLNKDLFEKLHIFDALAISMNNDHMMPKNERRFYFDALSQKYHPIYYDGHFSFLDKNLNEWTDGDQENIIPSVRYGAKDAEKLLNKIDLIKFNQKLNKYGHQISQDETQKAFAKIKKSLNILSKFNDNLIYQIKADLENKAFVKPNDTYDIKKNRRIVYNTNSDIEFISCNIYNEECENIQLNENEKLQLISQKLKDKNQNDLIYLGKLKTDDPLNGWVYQKNINEKIEINRIDNTDMLIIGKPSLDIDRENRVINIKRNSNKDRIVFKNGLLSEWKVYLNDSSKLISNIYSFDERNLTGCVNFYDVELDKIEFSSNGSKCEDAVNFVRSSGLVKKLSILNSAFDAMDSDFSKLTFENIEVNNSKNDCMDFSYGTYRVNRSFLENCGDKAISVGEKSNISIENTIIKNSNYAIVSKDYSTAKIADSVISNTKVCFQAFNKKQEFSGGLLKIKNVTCDESNYKKTEFDNKSEIKFVE